MMENFITCKNCGLMVFEKEMVWAYTHNSNLKELGYTCPSCQRKQIKTEREAKKEMVKNLELTELLKKRAVLTHFLEMLDLYEFELYVDEETNQFALSDNQHANLGDIEGDRFDNLASVINRMEIYHKDYIYESFLDAIDSSEEAGYWDIISMDFIESPIIQNIAEKITPDFFEEYKTDVLENSTEIIERLLNIQLERALRNKLREEAMHKQQELKIKGINIMREAKSILLIYLILDNSTEHDLEQFSKNLKEYNIDISELLSTENLHKKLSYFTQRNLPYENLYRLLEDFCKKEKGE